MALKALLGRDDHGKLSTDLQKLYVAEGDGAQLRLDVEPAGGWALEDVDGLKRTVSVTRKERDEEKKRAEAADAARKTAEDKAETMKSWTPEEKASERIKTLERQLQEKHQVEVAKRDASIVDLQGQLEEQLVTSAAVTAITEVKGSVPLLLPHVRGRVRVIKATDGKLVARVVDKDGHELITKKGGSTDPMSIKELVESMKTDATFAPAFAGSGITGSGAQGSRGAGGSGHANINTSLPPAERMKQFRRVGG